MAAERFAHVAAAIAGARPVLALLRIAGFVLAVVAGVGAARAQSPQFVLFTVSVRLIGQSVSVDVYRPSEAAPRGIAILVHGFTASRAHHRYLGEGLAASGFVAIVPDLPDFIDASRDAAAIVSLVHMIESGEAGVGVPATTRDRLVLVGTSFGGLVTVLAAADLPGLGGWVGLDPVDSMPSAVSEASKLTAPAVVLLGKPSLCNLYGSGSSIARAVPGLLRSTVVQEASHCDFEGPTNSVCRVACGPGSNATRTLVREEAVRAVAEMLRTPLLTRTSLISAGVDSSKR
jgi:dienelactone hydrolase